VDNRGTNSIISGDFGDKSGASSDKGYQYQKLIAAYYLVVRDVREIEYEADGEDITIINEDPNRDSIEFIQAKYMETGSFTFPKFIDDVFPQFWGAFNKALDKYPSKAIYCTLVSNVAWDRHAKIFMDRCFDLRQRGLTLLEIEHSMKPILRQYQLMKRGLDENKFRRFLWGLGMVPSFPQEHIRDKILKHISDCGISEPHSKLSSIIDYVSGIGQGRITKQQIEHKIGRDLNPVTSKLDRPIYSDIQIRNIVNDLNKAKTSYGTGKKYQIRKL
jgi:hypothetical protein